MRASSCSRNWVTQLPSVSHRVLPTIRNMRSELDDFLELFVNLPLFVTPVEKGGREKFLLTPPVVVTMPLKRKIYVDCGRSI